MTLVEHLRALRTALAHALHNINTRLTSLGRPPVRTVAAVPEALTALHTAAAAEGEAAHAAAFWDAYQQHGNRSDYSTAFSGYGWTAAIFHPTRPLYVVNGYMLFRNNPHLTSAMLAQASFDFSACQSLQYGFMACTALEEVADLGATRNLDSCFSGCTKLKSVQRLHLPTAENGPVTGLFWSCPQLQTVSVVGTLHDGNLGLQKSPLLSRDSIIGLVNALSDTATGKTLTLSQTAVNTAFETAAGAADGARSADWMALTATKPNWTFALGS